MVGVDLRRVVGYLVMLLAGIPSLLDLAGHPLAPRADWGRNVAFLLLGFLLLVSTWRDDPARVPRSA